MSIFTPKFFRSSKSSGCPAASVGGGLTQLKKFWMRFMHWIVCDTISLIKLMERS